MKVVVLAGGKGTRLGLTDRPKPMAPVLGKPLLERILQSARASGATEFIFLNGYLGEVIERHFGDGSSFGVSIAHVQEAEPRGTAGAVKAVRSLLTEPFVVLYGDVLVDVDLVRFVAFHKAKGGAASVLVHPNGHPYDSDLVQLDATDRVVRFLSKPHAPGAVLPNLVSAALYVLSLDVLDYVPDDTASDWGRDVLPAIASSGRPVFGYRSLEYAKDLGTPDRLREGEEDLRSGKVGRRSLRAPKPAIFFDRDGVLNKDAPRGVNRPEDLALLATAAAAVRAVNHAGVPAICVTNQPGLAKGFLTAGDLEEVLAKLDTELSVDGAFLDLVYVCPHHPEKGWPGEVPALKVECECRKPKAGLLLRAAREHNLDLERSWVIGDRCSDVEAARNAGARSVLLTAGNATENVARDGCSPDHIAQDVSEAVRYILERML